MKQLVIIGAGGFGREVLEWAMDSTAYGKEWEIGGFLDDRQNALVKYDGVQVPVLGSMESYQPRSDQVFLIALGNPQVKAEMWKRFTDRGAQFTRLIHESCVIGRNIDLGKGVILCPRVTLTCDISIGDNTAMNINTAVGHDAVIGRDCQFSSFCDITGHVRIGDRVMLGSRASIIPSKTVGNDAIVGAGSIVVSDVPDSVTVFGNPAMILTRHS